MPIFIFISIFVFTSNSMPLSSFLSNNPIQRFLIFYISYTVRASIGPYVVRTIAHQYLKTLPDKVIFICARYYLFPTMKEHKCGFDQKCERNNFPKPTNETGKSLQSLTNPEIFFLHGLALISLTNLGY